jgi:hypothetical protein
MPRQSKEARLSDLHARALQEFEDSYSATREDREAAALSRRFVRVRGAQWDWDTAGDFENKMRMEIDHIGGAIMRIRNEYRKNRIAASFLPADGSEADALSDAMTSRYRADTQDARGKEARALAFDGSLEGGYGGLRLRTEYEGDGPQQRICLEPVNDAEATLFFDVNAKLKDKSDAGHAFLLTPWARRAFVAEYGEECASWPMALVGKYQFGWFGTGTDFVFIAEYFVKETVNKTWRVFKGGVDGEDLEEFTEEELDADELERLKATGFKEIEPRVEKVGQVRKYVLNGAKVLEDGVIIAGPEIPLIPQYGQRTVLDHVERFKGHVLHAMDAQILYNLQVSKVAETAAVSGVRTPIFLGEQIAPYQEQWNNAHKNNPAFLTIQSMSDQNGNIQPAGPVGYLEPPEVAPAVAALIQIMRQDVADQMGNPENAEQLQPDQSGVALDLVQGRIDMQSYGYLDEAADAERRLAEVYQGMAAEIYVEPGRKLKTLSEEGKRGTVEIGRKVLNPKTGGIESEIDFSRARFDVEVDVGPTSASRRMSIVRTMSALMGQTQDPETNLVIGYKTLENLEAEGMQDIRDWARRKLLALGVAKPTKEEQAEIDAAAAAAGEQQPDPNAVLAGAMAQEAQAKAAKAVADTAKAEAQTQLTQAQTAETLAGIPIAQQRSALETAQAIMADMQETTTQGMPDAGQ